MSFVLYPEFLQLFFSLHIWLFTHCPSPYVTENECFPAFSILLSIQQKRDFKPPLLLKLSKFFVSHLQTVSFGFNPGSTGTASAGTGLTKPAAVRFSNSALASFKSSDWL